MKKIALFPGSFDPFTIGHHSVVNRALVMADEVVIAIGVNEMKSSLYSIDRRMEMLNALYADEPRIKIVNYEGLTAEYAEQIGASFILRGVRSVFDFEYERNMAEVNRQLTGIETVLLFTDPMYAHISSSVVRELIKLGKDVSNYLPK